FPLPEGEHLGLSENFGAPVNTGDLQAIYSGIGFFVFRLGSDQNGIRRRGCFRTPQMQTPDRRCRRPGALLVDQFLPPARSGRRSSHRSETRISAIDYFAEKGKREKKALRLSRKRGRGRG